jgi:hypothetical protein
MSNPNPHAANWQLSTGPKPGYFYAPYKPVTIESPYYKKVRIFTPTPSFTQDWTGRHRVEESNDEPDLSWLE